MPEGGDTKGGKGVPKGVVQGNADLGRAGYLGPCPDQGSGTHHYVLTLYALKAAEAETEHNASPGMILADISVNTDPAGLVFSIADRRRYHPNADRSFRRTFHTVRAVVEY